MKILSCGIRLLGSLVLGAAFLVSGCDLEGQDTGNLSSPDEGQKLMMSSELQSDVDVVETELVHSELDSAEGTMRIMEQNLFRPSVEDKEAIAALVESYLVLLAGVDSQSVTGKEGLEFIHPDKRGEYLLAAAETAKLYRDYDLKYEISNLETDFVIVTPLGARARVKGTISRTGKDLPPITGKPFTAFFYLQKGRDRWYIEKAPNLQFLTEMKLLDESEEEQIKQVLQRYIYATLHWDYHTVTGKEGFEFLAPPLFNENILEKIAAENVKKYRENEWVQTVNHMIVYFIHGTPHEAHATVAGTIDRIGKNEEQRNSPFEGHYRLKKVDGQWYIDNIEKFEG